MAIKKAKIEIFDSNGKKAGEAIEVLFNPSQYTLTESSGYSMPGSQSSNSQSSGSQPAGNQSLNCQTPGSQLPGVPTSNNQPMDPSKMMFTGNGYATLSMELFLDTGPVLTASGEGNQEATDVSAKVKELETLVYIKGELHAPPMARFVWGSLSFMGIVTELRTTFTQFTESGMPIQARVSLSLTSYQKKEDEQRVSPFESPDRTKCRMVREDYSIFDMAQNEYGDMSKWKIIARANQISNPLQIVPGTIVRIPGL